MQHDNSSLTTLQENKRQKTISNHNDNAGNSRNNGSRFKKLVRSNGNIFPKTGRKNSEISSRKKKRIWVWET